MENNLITLGAKPNVQYVIDADSLQRILKSVIGETLAELRSQDRETYLSSDEVMALLKVSKATLWRWERKGYLVPVRFGRKVLYKESDIKQIGGAEDGR